MSDSVKQRVGHLGAAQDAGLFAEAEVGGYNDTGALVEFATKIEKQRAT